MSHRPGPIRFIWRDGVLVPDGPRAARYCDDNFGEGEVVMMERHEERSMRSHSHFMACVAEAWNNLPEADSRFPNPTALRKWALIKNGYCTESSIVCDSPEQAATVAAFMGYTEGVVIVVRDNVVKRYIAKSQKMSGPDAMKPDEFQRSKNDVLDTLAELLRVKRRRLERAGGKA
jgi:hypothetical protein